ncbi:hypothetical protein KJ975_11135 [Myxococcota bacterium]|nr:hypothetical protein [Myxococcota bacterium]
MYKFLLPLTLVLVMSCDVDPTTVDACGDGIVDPGEECDSGIGSESCFTLGHYAISGQLRCNANCTWDRSDCGGWCGDGEIETEYGEMCEPSAQLQQTCEGLGYYGGTLACATDCAAYDESACAVVGRCGDGITQTGQEEVCDGEDLSGQTCEGLGYYGGTLGCQANCADFDESGCSGEGRCGDDTAQVQAGEVCDGADLAGQTCAEMGYHGGALACEDDCSAYILTDCISIGRCGDGAIQDVYGEACDGDALGGASCTSLEYYGGTLSCLNDCVFDLASCISAGRCGDGDIQALHEECDGDNLAGETCVGLGYYPGTLTCLGCTLDDSGCGGWCGDGTVQGTYEACDGSELGGHTCRTEGYFTGTLGCTGACVPDTAGCLNIVDIAAGRYHTCAVVSDGTVRCWGRNNYGQLGDNTTTTRFTPVSVLNITSAAYVTAGANHTCAVKTDGTVMCWGYNSSGQLGDNTTTTRNTPVVVSGISGVAALDAGYAHTCAVKTDGTAWCWGYNWKGQLGDNSTTNRRTPVAVSGLTGADMITAGYAFTCARLTDRTVRCWGQNSTGQLGINSITDSHVPVTVASLSNVYSLSAGNDHVCATTATNTIPPSRKGYCWGLNDVGQLGDGTTTTRLVPTQINSSFSSTVMYYVYAGDDHTCMNSVLAGTYYNTYCWGLNSDGQLSDGTTQDKLSPVNSGMTAPRHALGGLHSCLLTGTSLNSMRCWGDNQYGQLGDGTTIDSLTYVTVLP